MGSGLCPYTLHAKDELAVVVVGEQNRVRAIAPLCQQRRGRLELLGIRSVYEPMDFLYEDTDALCALGKS